MPIWLKELLKTDGKTRAMNPKLSYIPRSSKTRFTQNHALGIVPVVARLLRENSRTEYAYICHPSVQHVSKLPNEG
jgi:hypothetical protein